jgi:hypothetical protein
MKDIESLYETSMKMRRALNMSSSSIFENWTTKKWWWWWKFKIYFNGRMTVNLILKFIYILNNYIKYSDKLIRENH